MPQLVVRSERPLLRIRLGGPAGTGHCSSRAVLHSSDHRTGDWGTDVPSAPPSGATHPRTDRLIDVSGILIRMGCARKIRMEQKTVTADG